MTSSVRDALELMTSRRPGGHGFNFCPYLFIYHFQELSNIDDKNEPAG